MRLGLVVLGLVGALAMAACQAEQPTNQGRPDVTPPQQSRSPTPSPSADSRRASKVVFVYSAGGDIYAETRAGERLVIADGPKDEVWPSLSADGSELLYQLGSGPPGEIVHVDLESNTTTSLGPGEYPSFAPDGRAAWVLNNATDRPRIIVARPFSEPEAKIVAIADWDGPILVSPPLSWDLRSDYIYYSAGWEESSELYQSDSRGDVNPFSLTDALGTESSATHLLGPAVRERSSVHVFRACCMKAIEDPWESFELGRVKFTEGGPEYEAVIELDGAQFDQAFPSWQPQVVPLGHLWRDEPSGRWFTSEKRTWIVANQIDAWLLSENGGSQHLSDVLIQEYDYPTQHDGGIPGTFEGWGPGTLAG